MSKKRKMYDGQVIIGDLVMDTDAIETAYPNIKALRKAAAEFQTYRTNNAWMIPNYAEQRRYAERISTVVTSAEPCKITVSLQW